MLPLDIFQLHIELHCPHTNIFHTGPPAMLEMNPVQQHNQQLKNPKRVDLIEIALFWVKTLNILLKTLIYLPNDAFSCNRMFLLCRKS